MDIDRHTDRKSQRVKSDTDRDLSMSTMGISFHTLHNSCLPAKSFN